MNIGSWLKKKLCGPAGQVAGVLLLASIASAAPPKDSLAPLPVAVVDGQIRVTGAEPQGKILFVGATRSWSEYRSVFYRHRGLLSANAEGARSLQPSGGVAADSVWVAVDLQSGRYGAAAPANAPIRAFPIAADALKKANNGQLKKLIAKLPDAYFVFVRPGEGVWESTAGDGGSLDGDRSVDGAIELSLDDLRPVGDAGAVPNNFRKGDLLFVFSPEQTAFFVARLDK